MSWSKIIAFMLAVIAAVDIFFAVSIFKMNREKYYITDATVKDTATVMQNNGISIAFQTIPPRREEKYIYKCDISENYAEEVAEKICASSVLRRYTTPGGVVITLENGDRCEFTDTTELRYHKSGYEKISLPEETSFDGKTEGMSAKNYKKLISAFINAYGTGKRSPYPTDFTVASAYYDDTDGLYYVCCRQTVDRTDIFTSGFVCAIDKETIVAVDGSILFAPFNERIYSQLIDQINILINVKKYIETLRVGSNDGADGYFLSPEITSLEMCYCAYISSEDNTNSCLYFIPGWRISYGNGASHIFNAADGTVYTKKSTNQ